MLCLGAVETRVASVLRQQRGMGAMLHDAPVFQHVNAIGHLHRRKAVADEDRATPVEQGAEFVEQLRLGQRIELAVGRYNGELSPLKEFILPGGSRAAALVHLARTVCRRAERAVVAVGNSESVSDTSRKYLNRLSDLLFVLGRWLNKSAGCGDTLWQKGKNA